MASASWKKRYPPGAKRCRCRVAGCKARGDTPQDINRHRRQKHPELTKRKGNAKAKVVTALPSKPKMRKVQPRKPALRESPYRAMVQVMARDVLQEMVAQMRTG
jgi:hypothetical protein